MHMMMQGQATVGPPRCGSMGTPFRALPIPSPRLPGSVRRSDWVAITPSQTASKACRWKLAAVKSSQTLETADTDLIQLISDISKDVDSRHAGLLRDAKGATPDIEGLDSSLRGKAQTAILSLQSGLLERETEVGQGGWSVTKHAFILSAALAMQMYAMLSFPCICADPTNPSISHHISLAPTPRSASYC